MTTANEITIAVMVVSILLLIAGVVLSFFPKRYAVAPAYAGLLGIGLTAVHASASALVFWGVAAAIVLAIGYMLPRAVATSRKGVGYITGAVLAGAFVGMVVSHGWMVVGAVAGALLGGIAYSKTPVGRPMEFPSSKFLNYLCAKGLPAVVTVAIVGTAILWLTAAFG